MVLLLASAARSLLGTFCRRPSGLRSVSFRSNPDFVAVKKQLLDTYNDINATLMSHDPTSIPKDLITRLSRLKPIGDHLLTLETLTHCEEATETMLKEMVGGDADDLEELAAVERLERAAQMEAIDRAILALLVPPERFDDCAVNMEISAGIGGQEAMLFADELLRMYLRIAAHRGWNVDDVTETSSDIGGLRAGSLTISGENAYRLLKFESGIHRVQRVPLTGKKMHTSTAAVFVLPVPEEIDVSLNPADLKFEAFRSSGPGGQHVNTTSSAVRVTHLPSGTVAECQETKLQQKNREIALEWLRLKIQQREMAEHEAAVTANRKLHVGSRERSDKIRTYNFQQERMTDHRLQRSWNNLERMMTAPREMDAVFEALQEAAAEERLSEVLTRIRKEGWA